MARREVPRQHAHSRPSVRIRAVSRLAALDRGTAPSSAPRVGRGRIADDAARRTRGVPRHGGDGRADGPPPRAAGHQLTVYNRTAAKALAWVALNGNRPRRRRARPATRPTRADVRRQRRRRPRGRASATGVLDSMAPVRSSSTTRPRRPAGPRAARRCAERGSASSTPRSPVARPAPRTGSSP